MLKTPPTNGRAEPDKLWRENLQANRGNIIKFGWLDCLILSVRFQSVHHLSGRQLGNFEELFCELKAGQVIESADKRLCSVGVQQQLVTGDELDGLLQIIGIFKNTEQRAAYFQLLGPGAGPDKNRVRMSGTGERQLKRFYVQQTIAARGKLVAG
jgi:hypothetical protein